MINMQVWLIGKIRKKIPIAPRHESRPDLCPGLKTFDTSNRRTHEERLHLKKAKSRVSRAIGYSKRNDPGGEQRLGRKCFSAIYWRTFCWAKVDQCPGQYDLRSWVIVLASFWDALSVRLFVRPSDRRWHKSWKRQRFFVRQFRLV